VLLDPWAAVTVNRFFNFKICDSKTRQETQAMAIDAARGDRPELR
jgi:hypothetical protein